MTRSSPTVVSLTLAGVSLARRIRPEPRSTARWALKPKNALPRRRANPASRSTVTRPPVRPLAHVGVGLEQGRVDQSALPQDETLGGELRLHGGEERLGQASARQARRNSGRSSSGPAPGCRAAARRSGESSADRPRRPRARESHSPYHCASSRTRSINQRRVARAVPSAPTASRPAPPPAPPSPAAPGTNIPTLYPNIKRHSGRAGA